VATQGAALVSETRGSNVAVTGTQLRTLVPLLAGASNNVRQRATVISGLLAGGALNNGTRRAAEAFPHQRAGASDLERQRATGSVPQQPGEAHDNGTRQVAQPVPHQRACAINNERQQATGPVPPQLAGGPTISTRRAAVPVSVPCQPAGTNDNEREWATGPVPQQLAGVRGYVRELARAANAEAALLARAGNPAHGHGVGAVAVAANPGGPPRGQKRKRIYEF